MRENRYSTNYRNISKKSNRNRRESASLSPTLTLFLAPYGKLYLRLQDRVLESESVRLAASPPVLATWDIRSENRPVVHDGASFFAKACEMRVQSTRSMLLVFSGHTPIFTKERFSWCFV